MDGPVAIVDSQSLHHLTLLDVCDPDVNPRNHVTADEFYHLRGCGELVIHLLNTKESRPMKDKNERRQLSFYAQRP